MIFFYISGKTLFIKTLIVFTILQKFKGNIMDPSAILTGHFPSPSYSNCLENISNAGLPVKNTLMFVFKVIILILFQRYEFFKRAST